MNAHEFRYHEAFDRNLGWLSESEQERLRNSCVAVAGVGGAGGFQAQVLARLGVGRFKIADLDVYELTNLNRQVGASMQTLGQPKVEVMKEMILSINPEASVEAFPDGIHEGNVDRFLDGADVVMDGVDFFVLDAKILLFRKSREHKIPVVTSCPLGFGASILVFSPEGMSFENYFDLRPGMSEEERRLAFTFGLSPAALSLKYRGARILDVKGKRGSSVCAGLMLVGALAGAEAVKILAGKWAVAYAPHIFQIDMMTQRVHKKYYPGGMQNPIQRFKRKWIMRQWASGAKK